MTAQCFGCGEVTVLMPLHGPKGGPLRCPLCVGAWNAEHGRRRRAGRIVIRAMQAFQDAGGAWTDIDKLRLSAAGLGVDTLGYGADIATEGEAAELTSELLTDVLRLTHPDAHPDERKDLANRVTQDLLALQPYVFPAPKPKAKPKSPTSDDRNGLMTVAARDRKDPLRAEAAYPCDDCKSEVPRFYCDACRREWEKRQQVERARERAKRREWRERRKARIPAKTCKGCGEKFKGKRADARFCSSRCRQRAHRKAVTDKRSSTTRALVSRDSARWGSP